MLPPAMVSLAARTVSVLVVALTLVGTIELVVFSSVLSGTDVTAPFFLALFVGIPATLGGVGILILWRQPRNPIGWILAVAGLFASCAIYGGAYSRASIDAHGGSLPGTAFAAWLGGWAFLPTVGLMVGVLPLVFPSGNLLSRRWRPVLAAGLAGILISALGMAFAPGPLGGDPAAIPNPFAVEGMDPFFAFAAVVNGLAGPLVFAAGVVAIVVRFRRSRGVEREQLKWFLYAAVIAMIMFLTSFLTTGTVSDVAWALGLASLIFLPVAVGIAILRYHLYEIDRVISRTVAYAVVTAILLTTFGAAILVFQEVLAPVFGGNTVAVAASTLVVAALFQPLRRRVQRVVDRRFDRVRYDADHTLLAFADRLRDEVDLDHLALEMTGVVERSLAPAWVGVWVRDR